MPANVLILGCGRSGTSIFGELFEHIGGYTCYSYCSEPDFESILEMTFEKPVAIKVPKESPRRQPTAGLSFPLDLMLETIPNPRMIYWQVRHPLDAIASLRVGISNDWDHHPRPPDWKSWQHRPLVEQCAHHWNFINSVGYGQVQSLVEITRFEDMISDPFSFAAQVCEHIGVDVAAQRSELRCWSDRVQDTNNSQFVEARTSRAYSRPDHERRVGRWKENLNEAEAAQSAAIVRDAAATLGYEIP